ncbi:hypothetical protein ABUL04_21785 [Micromonospora harpali]|uniref:Lipoprotein n=1 Tax=Micromonospora harpali TaxID=1490225 RepID=A0ABW1HHF3_9ACTN
MDGTIRITALACAILATSSCTASHAKDRYQTADATIAEYRDETKRLTLAPGWHWPTDLSKDFPSQAEDRKQILYEVNRGRVGASLYWHCSWARTLLSSDSSKHEEARAQVKLIRESALFKWGLAGKEKSYWERLLGELDNGATDEYKKMIDTNCPGSSA